MALTVCRQLRRPEFFIRRWTIPYTTPPVFVDAVLSAAQLNVLSDDIEYFYGLSSTVNIPFVHDPAFQGGNNTTSYWQIRHRARYLNIYISYFVDPTWNDHLSWTVLYGPFTLSTIDPIVYANPGYVTFDLDTLGPAVAGTWYQISVAVRAHSAAHGVQTIFGDTTFTIQRLFESDTAA